MKTGELSRQTFGEEGYWMRCLRAVRGARVGLSSSPLMPAHDHAASRSKCTRVIESPRRVSTCSTQESTVSAYPQAAAQVQLAWPKGGRAASRARQRRARKELSKIPFFSLHFSLFHALPPPLHPLFLFWFFLGRMSILVLLKSTRSSIVQLKYN